MQKLLEDGYTGKIDLIYTDPPWGIMKEGRSQKIIQSDKVYSTDIKRAAELMAKLVAETG